MGNTIIKIIYDMICVSIWIAIFSILHNGLKKYISFPIGEMKLAISTFTFQIVFFSFFCY